MQRLTTSLTLLIGFLLSSWGWAQSAVDTLTYSPQQVEGIFLQNNLPLLANRLQIDQGDARILQAKVWPNPVLTLDQVQLYVNATAEESPPLFGNFWRNRQFAVQLDQLIYTAGKRKKNIVLQTQTKELAERSFIEFMQALKVELRQSLADLLYLQRTRQEGLFQLTEVNRLLAAQQSQFRQGNISRTDLYRFTALQLSLRKSIQDIQEQVTQQQQSLKTLLALPPTSYLVLADSLADPSLARLKELRLADLLALAHTQNASVQVATQERRVSEASLRLERANRVPDLTASLMYDRNGNTQLNFLGTGVSMALPVFDKNKGNIKVAQLEVQKAAILEKNKLAEVDNAVVKTWTDLTQALQFLESIDATYIDQLQNLTQGVSRSFAQRNLSLLEFLDLFDSFREGRANYFDLLRTISLRRNELNYLTGSDF
ncbi:TolC family protein [Spirosoma terrae]|uniref:TolC family protein n=1 Tax=Spirosoma terrae TaxID=1968276 RepID=A0A6L9L6J2_9BACT|nr:TolC family protein [Spirosoma terrae]NDU95087.1 TolC family protein [Spirosoma terrae]